jgi:hypothetical protein
MASRETPGKKHFVPCNGSADNKPCCEGFGPRHLMEEVSFICMCGILLHTL